jgi:hypothetical protein
VGLKGVKTLIRTRECHVFRAETRRAIPTPNSPSHGDGGSLAVAMERPVLERCSHSVPGAWRRHPSPSRSGRCGSSSPFSTSVSR